MFVDEKHLFRQSPTLTLLSLTTSLWPRAKENFGICAPGRIRTTDCCRQNGIYINCCKSSQIYFWL